MTDRRTDGQNYDSQDRASIAASRDKNKSIHMAWENKLLKHIDVNNIIEKFAEMKEKSRNKSTFLVSLFCRIILSAFCACSLLGQFLSLLQALHIANVALSIHQC